MMPTWCLTDALLWTKASKPMTPASLQQDQSQSSPESTMLTTGEWREKKHQWQSIHMHVVCVCAHVHVVPILLMYIFVVRTYVALASSVLAVNISPVATATYVHTYNNGGSL